jgi:hypothetical protein
MWELFCLEIRLKRATRVQDGPVFTVFRKGILMRSWTGIALLIFIGLGMAACQLAVPLEPAQEDRIKPTSSTGAYPGEKQVGTPAPTDAVEPTVAETPEPSPSGISSTTPGELAPVGTVVTPDGPAQKMIDLAKAQLVRKLSIPLDNISLFEAAITSWPDSSLGCPRSGFAYSQVITPGYRILLEAKGQTYSFHTDTLEQVILCDARGPDEIFPTP